MANDLSYLAANPTAVVAAIAATIALFSLRSQRHLTRAKHTLDFDKDFKEKHRETMIRCRGVITKKSAADLVALAKGGSVTAALDEPFTALVLAINIWESVAIGIKSKVYLEDMLFESYGSTIAYLYLASVPFIRTRQIENRRLYKHLDWLGMRWTVRLASQGALPHFPSLQANMNKTTDAWRHDLMSELLAKGWSPPTRSAADESVVDPASR